MRKIIIIFIIIILLLCNYSFALNELQNKINEENVINTETKIEDEDKETENSGKNALIKEEIIKQDNEEEKKQVKDVEINEKSIQEKTQLNIKDFMETQSTSENINSNTNSINNNLKNNTTLKTNAELNLEINNSLENSTTVKTNPELKLTNGVYFIVSACNTNKVLDISGASKSNNANVQIWENVNVLQQKFKITKQSDGYYIIENVNSNKCLDVANGVAKESNNVWQYEKNYSNAQKWKFEENEDGYCNIKSKIGKFYLTLKEKDSKNGTNIQINSKNELNTQKFKFIQVPEYWGKKSIENGTYYISSAIDKNKVMHVSSSSNIMLWKKENLPNQKFIVTYDGYGNYTIECYHSGKAVDVANGIGKAGNNVWEYDSNYTLAQKWVIKDAGDGYYYIISKIGGYYLDVSNGNSTNGTNIQIYSGNESKAQKFSFTKIEELSGKQVLEDGIYSISTKLNTNKVLDISQASTQSCANVQIWDNVYEKQQKFRLSYIGNGFYNIKNVNSNKSLDVANGKNSSGTNVWQYETNNSNAQQWIIKQAEDGYYYIISRCGGLYLDVQNASTKSGTNIWIYSGNKSNAQKFKFNKEYANGIDVSSWQGEIDWQKVKENKKDFAILRVGFRGYETGKIVQDTKYKTNISNAVKNGIECGVYFVTQAINYNEGVEEAKWVLDVIKGDQITCPITIDVEWAGGDKGNNGRADNITTEERTNAIKGFCETILKAGYTPMIYANKDWLINYINMKKLSTYKVWLAHYVNGAPDKASDYTGKYEYWQYTSSGTCSGINGYIDLDKCYM